MKHRACGTGVAFTTVTLVTQPMLQLRPNWLELRSMDCYHQIFYRFRKCKQKLPPPSHIVRKAGKKFKKSRKFDVLDLYEIDMGGPYAPSVPCTVHKNDFYSLVWL